MSETPNSPDSLFSQVLGRQLQPIHDQLQEQNQKFNSLISALLPLPERINSLESQIAELNQRVNQIPLTLRQELSVWLEQLTNALNEERSSEAAEALMKQLSDLIRHLDRLNNQVQTMTSLQRGLHESIGSLSTKLDRVSPTSNGKAPQ